MNIFQFIDALSKLETISEGDPQLYQTLKSMLVLEWNAGQDKRNEQSALEERMKSMGLHIGDRR